MAGQEKEAYIALIAARDAQIRALVEEGFEFVMNTFKEGSAPPGLKGNTGTEQVRRLHQAGYQVAVTTGYDGLGTPRPTLCASWRKKP
jgi:hypothetical protein